MVPSFASREALPERPVNQSGPLYEPSVPHPGLGCGYSAAAFTKKELSLLPQWLQATGTIVHWETGYLSPGATIYCPFLTFERAYGNKEHRVEPANNQCAIAGSYSVRALEMLYALAAKDSSGYQVTESPVSFSCTIDNSFAMLNLHWIDFSNGQTYCMAPICQFDLSKDVHFSKFLIWTQAIGDWALSHLLDKLKDALERLSRCASPVTPAPFYPIRRASIMQSTQLRVDTGSSLNKDEILISSLQTTFDNIPWRFENERDSGLSSSTASWGSPMVSDLTFTNLNYPTVHPPRSNASISTPNSSIVARRRIGKTDQPNSPVALSPAYLQSQETLWQKRFNYAMDEIKELSSQLQTFQQEMQTLKGSIKEDTTQVRSPVEFPSPNDDENTTTVEPTPITPKAQFRSPFSVLEPSSSPITTISTHSPILGCATIMLSGYVLAQYLPGRPMKVLAYGCAAAASVLTLLRGDPAGVSWIAEMVGTRRAVFGLWKKQ